MRYEDSVVTARSGIFQGITGTAIQGTGSVSEVGWSDANRVARPTTGTTIASPGIYTSFLNGAGNYSKPNCVTSVSGPRSASVDLTVVGVSTSRELPGSGIVWDYTIEYKYTRTGFISPIQGDPPLTELVRVSTGTITDGNSVSIRLTAADFSFCVVAMLYNPIGFWPDAATITASFDLGTYSISVNGGEAEFPQIVSGQSSLDAARLARIQDTRGT